MKNQEPHILAVGGITYEIGKIEKEIIHYDFDKILLYLKAKGRELFGKKFTIYNEDIPIIYKLSVYAIQDAEACKKLNIDPNKGILLTGPVGCGKTSLMKLLRHLTPHKKAYKIIPCRNAVFSFNHLGFKTIEDYGNDDFYCFDDIGIEPTGKHFGVECNVIGEILLSRYELSTHKDKKIKTHGTTNLNANEIEDRYGNRVRSRMRALFNLIAFDKNCRDKRK